VYEKMYAYFSKALSLYTSKVTRSQEGPSAHPTLWRNGLPTVRPNTGT
jgi:hypothetical protein